MKFYYEYDYLDGISGNIIYDLGVAVLTETGSWSGSTSINEGINYLVEYPVKNPKTGHNLRFDFYLPGKNIFIEWKIVFSLLATLKGKWNNRHQDFSTPL